MLVSSAIMKHVNFGDKSLLMGDDAADSLLEYASLLAQDSSADTVTVQAVGPDGNTVDVALLLNSSSIMAVESTNSTMDAPENTEAVRYMQERIDRLQTPTVRPANPGEGFDYDLDPLT
jgi:hypothetical protein